MIRDPRPGHPGHLLLTAALLCLLPAATQAAADAYTVRLEAALLLQTLNADLLGHDSATLTLQRWCDTHRLASPARVVVERVREAYRAPSEEQRQQLRVTATQEVRYRRVKLLCGTVVLAEADNWYVPARLTPAINRQLDGTDTPFGVAIQSLHFQRHTLSAEVLWQPLPEGWEMRPPAASGTAAEVCIPPQLLRHRALLLLPDGTPISEVVETYTGAVLALPRLASLHHC
jgi:chorismate-pyruvate lyase